MPQLTRALVANHGRARAEAFNPALLDVAQDHLLYLLATAGRFDGDDLIFKGGTSLRKCRIGGNGRFSTDLDFAAPSDQVVVDTCELIDGAVIGGGGQGVVEATTCSGSPDALSTSLSSGGSGSSSSAAGSPRRRLPLRFSVSTALLARPLSPRRITEDGPDLAASRVAAAQTGAEIRGSVVCWAP